MFEITVKWPGGKTVTVGGFEADMIEPWVDFLRLCGAEEIHARELH